MANNFDEYSQSTKFDIKPWKLPFSFFIKHKKHTIILLITTLVSASVEAVYPYFSRYAINEFIEKNTLEGIFAFVAAYTFFLGITAVTTIIFSRKCMFLVLKIGKERRDSAFE